MHRGKKREKRRGNYAEYGPLQIQVPKKALAILVRISIKYLPAVEPALDMEHAAWNWDSEGRGVGHKEEGDTWTIIYLYGKKPSRFFCRGLL